FSKNLERSSIFCLCFLPFFFFDMTMNGIRYGLAYSLTLLAYDNYKNKLNIYFILYVSLALLIHISSILLVGLLLIDRINILKIKKTLLLTLITIPTFFIFLFLDRILYKISFYSSQGSPSSISGLMPLIIFLLLYLIIIISNKKAIKSYYFPFLTIIQIFSFLLSGFTYMGIRIQFIILFALICKTSEYFKITKQNLILLLIIGALCFAGRYRNMIDEYGKGPSPFLPYTFYWQNNIED
ncbi:EpsG family protein, partial [Xenorhabdus bovienii]|uniref:EpsG family protein n=1 Tax=Xenorhabdus bovienii TaxID=40576 RepID=UPI003DA2C2CA